MNENNKIKTKNNSFIDFYSMAGRYYQALSTVCSISDSRVPILKEDNQELIMNVYSRFSLEGNLKKSYDDFTRIKQMLCYIPEVVGTGRRIEKARKGLENIVFSWNIDEVNNLGFNFKSIDGKKVLCRYDSDEKK